LAFNTPLADQLRPQSLDQMVGQPTLLDPGQPLRQIIDQHVNIPLISGTPDR
jgi:ATPase related to the helicase subunit of the Holliday junction resolvase